jgi:hypothetical protein
VSPVRYELALYILEDDILHSYRRGNVKSYIAFISSSQKIEAEYFPETAILDYRTIRCHRP